MLIKSPLSSPLRVWQNDCRLGGRNNVGYGIHKANEIMANRVDWKNKLQREERKDGGENGNRIQI